MCNHDREEEEYEELGRKLAKKKKERDDGYYAKASHIGDKYEKILEDKMSGLKKMIEEEGSKVAGLLVQYVHDYEMNRQVVAREMIKEINANGAQFERWVYSDDCPMDISTDSIDLDLEDLKEIRKSEESLSLNSAWLVNVMLNSKLRQIRDIRTVIRSIEAIANRKIDMRPMMQ